MDDVVERCGCEEIANAEGQDLHPAFPKIQVFYKLLTLIRMSERSACFV